jgi:hypothetical protein
MGETPACVYLKRKHDREGVYPARCVCMVQNTAARGFPSSRLDVKTLCSLPAFHLVVAFLRGGDEQ